MNVNAARLPTFKVSVLSAPNVPPLKRTGGGGADENITKDSPPLDPAYVASIDAHGRIIHRVEKFHSDETKTDKQQRKVSSDDEVKDGSTKFAPPDVLDAQPADEAQQRQTRTAAFPTPKVNDLFAEDGGAKRTTGGKTQVLSLSEAREKRDRGEREKKRLLLEQQQSAIAAGGGEGRDLKEHTIAELLAQNARKMDSAELANRTEEHVAPSLETLRAQEWNYWSSMPSAIERFDQKWRRDVQQETCATCQRVMCSACPRSSQPVQNPALHSTSAGMSVSDGIHQPWNAGLADDDIDLCAVRCMREAAEQQMIRCAKNVRETGDAWMLLPCQHVLHGFPCAMQHIVSEKRDCPRCNERVSHTVKALDGVLDNHNIDKTSEERLSELQKAQNAWLLNTIKCPPALLREKRGAKCADIIECACAPIAAEESATDSLAQHRLPSAGRNGDGDGSADLGGWKSRQHLLEVIDKAQQRLVRKYVLLDRMQTALDAEDTSQFRVHANDLQLLVPREAREQLWQVLEPPREHRPNVQRAVSLAKSAATLSSQDLQWLVDHRFLDEDTMIAMVRDLDEQWFSSLTDASQRILLSQAMSTGTLGLWNASWAAHVRAPTTFRELVPKRSDGPILRQWASTAEENGRFAVAVEMRDLASKADDGEK